MKEIRKTINIDNCRSHRSGLLPFVHYGSDNTSSRLINDSTGNNGNYGQYACDFCIYSGNAETKIEIKRLPYLNVLSDYRYIHKRLLEGVYTKKIKSIKKEVKKVDCALSEDNDDFIEEVKTEIINLIKFQDDEKIMIDYVPMDITLFDLTESSYVFHEPFDYINAIEKEESERTEEDIYIIEKVNNHKKLLESNEFFFVLLKDYDSILKINNDWDSWWKENLNEIKWETYVFDGYEPYDCYLKFYYDICRYVIGEIEVPPKYVGSLVPSYVYYSNCYDLKTWFESHSANTINAYENLDNSTEWIINEWEAHGGGEFYDFLQNITSKWQKYKDYVDVNNGRYFKYSVPYINIEILINSDIDNEYLYTPYEYSLINNEFEGVVKPYKPVNFDDIIYVDYAYNDDSALTRYNKYFYKDSITINDDYKIVHNDSLSANGLTKQWLDCSTSSAYCESQLTSLMDSSSFMVTDEIFGIYKFFDEKTPERGQLFECTFCTGWSETPKIMSYYSSTTITNLNNTNDKTDIFEINKEYSYEYETYVGSIDEKSPSTTAYQITNVTIISESAGTVNKIVNKVDGNSKIEELQWSSITWNKYSWWECNPITNDNIICGDGEIILANDNTKYRNVTIVSCINTLVDNCKDGDKFYVMARYDNGNIKPKRITENGTIHSISYPYRKNNPVNIVSYDNGTIVYDKVFSLIENDENKTITIKYAKGITSGNTLGEIEKNEQNTGIHYEEVLKYEKNKREYIHIDGTYKTEVYYDKLGDKSDKIIVHSYEYFLDRPVNIAKITGMEICTQWTEESSVDAMLITKESTDGLQEEPKYNINLLYNRGNAAAWENHFKLSECNTMEDLENYGNNFFNL